MLVLSRKTEQSIQIGADIVIRVLRVKGNQVRLGIEAPREVRVIRDELQVGQGTHQDTILKPADIVLQPA